MKDKNEITVTDEPIVLLDRKVDRDIPEVGEKDYRVMDITTVNPHRGEICKLASGDFTVTTSSFGRTVDNVYRIDTNGALQKCDFEQKNGKVRKPSVSVKAGEKTFSASEFAVKYSGGRKNVGKYSVTVTMKGKYTGKKTVTFRINPKGTAVHKLTKGRKMMKVTWKAQKTQVSGYRIQTYKTVGGSKYYSGWSKAKNVKTK